MGKEVEGKGRQKQLEREDQYEEARTLLTQVRMERMGACSTITNAYNAARSEGVLFVDVPSLPFAAPHFASSPRCVVASLKRPFDS